MKGTSEAWLCRSNAGVFAKAWECVETGTPFSLAGGVSSCSFDELLDVEKWMLSRRAPARLKDAAAVFGTFKEWEAYAKDYEPHAAAQCALVRRHAGQLRSMLDQIKKRCGRASQKSLCISTAHKAKGGEWDSIGLASDFYDFNKDILAPAAAAGKALRNVDDPALRQAWTKGRKVVHAEELRLLYVAVTRTKGRSRVPDNYRPLPSVAQRFRQGLKSGSIVLV